MARGEYERELKRIIKKLPIWPHVRDNMFGLGDLGLALIVGAAGDLANYSNPAKLWKRMGMAVIDGERQRKCTDAEKAVKHGYKPANRAILWNIEDAIVKVGGPYRALYDERKIIELAKGLTKMHAHNRAKRYVGKRLLRDLWNAWNGRSHGDSGFQLFVAPPVPS